MTELQLHFAVADYLRRVMPPGIPWSHFPAGERRDAKTGAKLKRMGLNPGWPDFIILTNPVICIELKTDKGRMTPSQKIFAADVQSQDHTHFVARNIETIEMALQQYGIPLKGKMTA